MFLVAGAPGSGKSALMPVAALGVDSFNADDAAAVLNGNSYIAIPKTIRNLVNKRLERFIDDHIGHGISFAVETTLRSPIALEQAEKARRHGFYTTMSYICTEDESINLRRVAVRAEGGGHSAPEATLLDIRNRSLQNLWRAIDTVGSALDTLIVLDNSIDGRSLTQAFTLRYSLGNNALSLEQFTVPAYLQPYLLAAAARAH